MILRTRMALVATDYLSVSVYQTVQMMQSKQRRPSRLRMLRPRQALPELTAENVTVPVYFAFDDYTLGAEAQDQLAKLAEYMKAKAATSRSN